MDNIYMQKEFETGLATMCLERGREESVLLFFPRTFWQLSQCLRCREQTSKGSQDKETTNSEDTEACYHPIPKLSVLICDVWLTHSLSASSVSSSVSPLPYGKCLSLAIWPLDSGQIDSQSSRGVCVDVRHPLVDRQMSRIWLNTVDTEFLDLAQDNVAKS